MVLNSFQTDAKYWYKSITYMHIIVVVQFKQSKIQVGNVLNVKRCNSFAVYRKKLEVFVKVRYNFYSILNKTQMSLSTRHTRWRTTNTKYCCSIGTITGIGSFGWIHFSVQKTYCNLLKWNKLTLKITITENEIYNENH